MVTRPAQIPTRRDSSRASFAVVVLILLSLAARFVFARAAVPQGLAATVYYAGESAPVVEQGRATAAGELWHDGLPLNDPLAPSLFGLLWRLVGPGMVAALLAQAAVVTLTVLVTWVLARRLLGATAAFLAAALTAVSFPADAFAATLDGQALYQLFLVLTALLLVEWARHKRAVVALALGVVTGLATLTRSEHIVILPLAVLATWLAGGRGRAALASAVIVVVTALATLAPWTARNYVILTAYNDAVAGPLGLQPLGPWVTVSFRGPLNFALANNARSDGSYSRRILASAGRSSTLDLLDPGHRDLLNHGYSWGRLFVRSHPAGAAALAGRKLVLYARGFRTGFTGRDLPLGLPGERRSLDLYTPSLGGVELVVLALVAAGLVVLGGEALLLLVPLAGTALISLLWTGQAKDAAALLPLVLILALGVLRRVFPRAERALGWPAMVLIAAFLFAAQYSAVRLVSQPQPASSDGQSPDASGKLSLLDLGEQR